MHSIEQIKNRLLDRLADVIDHYAPRAEGSYTAFGRHHTLNPGRADRHVGSFYIHLNGDRAGQWRDHATGGFGDVLDLIGLSLNLTDAKEQLREARRFLGISNETPEQRRDREARAEKGRQRRIQAEKDRRTDEKRKAGAAQRLWLGAQPRIQGTPVEFYLRATRGIDLGALNRQPGALRYMPECWYQDIDEETGEVIEGRWPAMLAAIVNASGEFVAVHRTWLAPNSAGCWDKAPVPKPKKVLGNYYRSAINLWRGIGPRGGKPASLPKCPPDSRVFIAEGVEDALSTILLLPEQRVIAAISLSNLGAVDLPDNVSQVTLVADRDEGPAAQDALQRAITQHQNKGRSVRVFENTWGGKDLNDALCLVRDQTSQEGEDSDDSPTNP